MVGCAALRPMLEVLPAPSLTVKRAFRVGHMKLVVGANLEVKEYSRVHPHGKSLYVVES